MFQMKLLLYTKCFVLFPKEFLKPLPLPLFSTLFSLGNEVGILHNLMLTLASRLHNQICYLVISLAMCASGCDKTYIKLNAGNEHTEQCLSSTFK